MLAPILNCMNNAIILMSSGGASMADLTIRGVSDELHTWLKQQARAITVR